MSSRSILLFIATFMSITTSLAQEGGAQNCVSTFAQATCMGPWFGWNEPSHLSQGLRILQIGHEIKAILICISPLHSAGMVAHWIGFLSLFGATIGLGIMSWNEKGPG